MPLPQANLLSEETSPYLRQHKDNPVHWRPWSAATLTEARELDRPILLSVGYAACHWCHVMAHECFEDAEVAELMNRLYVNIKVDREERPDIDQIYMAALSATGEQGGWPLTMFLTPEAQPFWGGTYFPKQPRYGRPGFMQVLESIDRAWRDKRGELAASAETLKTHVESTLSARAPVATETARTNLPALAGGIHSMIDQSRGGLRGAPKFPNAPFMQTLWLSWLETGEKSHRDAVLLSLRPMLNGGIYDHIGGGLCRYSTDADWLVPHFEKMLYDNAMLIRLANWAYAETGDQLFRERIETTIGWLVREMRIDGGGFAASLDADSDGEEGSFYTWAPAEIETAWRTKRRPFSLPTRWLRRTAGKASPSSAGTPAPPDRPRWRRCWLSSSTNAKSACVPAATTKCWPIGTVWRSRRLPRPPGIWAAPIGLMLRGVPTVSFPNQKSSDGRLPHSILGDRRLYPAMSSDYAAMANAAIALYEATAEAAYLADAVSHLEALDRWYIDDEDVGHYLTAVDSSDVPVRIRGDVDEAIPSATSQIIEAFARVATATGRMDLADRAWAIARAASGRIRNQAYGQAGIVNACAVLEGSRKLVLVDNPDTLDLSQVAARHPDPRRVDLVLPLGAEPVELPGSVYVDTGKQAAWLCLGQSCLPPINDPQALAQALQQAKP